MPNPDLPAGAVVVVGSYVQDHAWFCDTFARDGETRRAHGFNTGPGGKGFNQAVACHRQGVPTAFVGAIGDDHLGAIAQRFAHDEGLDARWQVFDDAPTAASSILVDARGINRIAVSLGANERLDAAFVRAQVARADSTRMLLCQLENGLDAIAAAFEAARPGVVRVLNPAPMHPAFDLAMLESADIITPNETEFALLLARCGRDRVDPDALADTHDEALHALARGIGAQTVVITLGAHGCFVSHADADRHGDAAAWYRLDAEPVRTIDSTGAGDAFNGALVAGMLLFPDTPFRHVVRHANRTAALSTETIGTAPAMPTCDAVIKRFGNDA